MAQINSSKASDILIKLIDQFDIEQERINTYKTNWYGAVKVSGEISEAWVIDPLITILKDEDFIGSSSCEAAIALGKIGTKRAVETLTYAMETGDDYMKKYAGDALKAITGKNFWENLVN